MSLAGLRPFSLVVWLTVAALAGIVAFTACAGVVSMPLAWIVALGAGAVGWRTATHPGVAMLVEPSGPPAAVAPLLRVLLLGGGGGGGACPGSLRRDGLPTGHRAHRRAATEPGTVLRRRPRVPAHVLPLPRLLALVTPDFWGFRRRWFAINLAGVAIGLITVAHRVDVGWTRFAAFLDHLPKILSGEAFPGLFRPPAIAVNESIPGVVFKLGLWGVPGFPQAQVVGWAYTLVLVAAIAWLALRRSDRGLDPVLWIAILVLATLLAAWAVRTGAPLLPIVALWLVLATSVGQGFLTPPANAVLTLSHTIASPAVVVLACRRTGAETS